jgi:hypothetical protein
MFSSYLEFLIKSSDSDCFSCCHGRNNKDNIITLLLLDKTAQKGATIYTPAAIITSTNIMQK